MEPLNVTARTPDEVTKLLEPLSKPLLCLVPWDRIEFIQSREKTDEALVAEYQESLANGDKLPPSKGIFVHNMNICKVFDGIHTATARHNLGQSNIPVLLHLGTAIDADIAAAGANFANGARRSNADKRNAIKMLLRNPELACLSNNKLAEIARVSAPLIEEMRVELESDPVSPVFRPKKRRVSRNGGEYEIDSPVAQTSSSGKSSVMDPEKAAKRVIDYLAKLLKARPAEECSDVCGRVLTAIRQTYSLE